MSDPVEVLDFWLGEIGPEGWYAGTEEIDDACAVRFETLLAALREGGLEHWVEGPAGALAYIVIADQFARNIHRGTSLAFATDPQALEAAKKSVAAGWDLKVPEPDRQFFYMPYEHSENPEDQESAIRLMEERLGSDPEMALHARAHAEMIRRYGRFPARNAALGRDTTPEEAEFLAQGGYGALVRQMQS